MSVLEPQCFQGGELADVSYEKEHEIRCGEQLSQHFLLRIVNHNVYYISCFYQRQNLIDKCHEKCDGEEDICTCWGDTLARYKIAGQRRAQSGGHLYS